jgi:drug/metabolite transporter (DMT)-like permease
MAAWLVFRDKIGIFNLIGIVVSVVGVLIIIMEPDMSFLVSVKGIALLFLAVASAVGYTMLIRKLSSDYHPAAIITYMNLMGIPFFIPLFFWLDFSAFTYTSIDTTVFWIIIALGVFPSSLSYMFFTIGVRDLGVNRASVFTNMIPALTAVFSYFFLGDHLPWYKVVGIAVVIGALMLSQMDSFRKNAVR